MTRYLAAAAALAPLLAALLLTADALFLLDMVRSLLGGHDPTALGRGGLGGLVMLFANLACAVGLVGVALGLLAGARRSGAMLRIGVAIPAGIGLLGCLAGAGLTLFDGLGALGDAMLVTNVLGIVRDLVFSLFLGVGFGVAPFLGTRSGIVRMAVGIGSVVAWAVVAVCEAARIALNVALFAELGLDVPAGAGYAFFVVVVAVFTLLYVITGVGTLLTGFGGARVSA